MANQLPAFVSSSQLLIKIRGSDVGGDANGDFLLAYATNLQFSHNMATTGVQTIGAYANQAIEPLAYSAGGSFSIMNFTTGNAPGRTPNSQVASGNSFLHRSQMFPRRLLLSTTFDIDVYMKEGSVAQGASLTNKINIQPPKLTPEQQSASVAQLDQNRTGTVIYRIYDCRLTDWSLSFAPGQLSSERVSFVCRGVQMGLLGNSQDQQNENVKGAAELIAGSAPTI